MPAPLPAKTRLVADHVRQVMRKQDLSVGDPLPTERDLARQLGVGQITVRRGLAALVDEGLIERRVGVGTFVARTLAAPNRLLNLAIGVSESIRHLPIMGYYLAGVRAEFPVESARIELLPVSTRELVTDEEISRWAASLAARGVDGYLLQQPAGTRIPVALRRVGIAFVSMGFATEEPGVPQLREDTDVVFEQIIHEAHRFGHRDIGLAVWNSLSGIQHTGFARVCRRYNLLHSCARVFTCRAPLRAEADDADVSAIFAGPLPSLLIVNDEIMAMAVTRELQARGLQVPRDISLAALIDSAPAVHPVPLTAVNGPQIFFDRYRQAARMLRRRLQGDPTAPLVETHSSRVEFRASLGPAPVRPIVDPVASA